ncbi:hypothetical protein [Tessaracoccus sp. OH4464_COT-324]|uniref:hypothetical protein n=1 Tax=Tessaracoccus sp. OH4464_COT-324 TaxID=2491059 RepID=UPI000F62F953|nr:hypothetical protein [Tessaracoccus sp. OH4464_COT-324]RRD47076.1 hypothetical protein EII42_03575 [Tessaracoccus sp. OH4464_COT-324]
MTDVVVDDEAIGPATGEILDQKELADRLLMLAREQGVGGAAGVRIRSGGHVASVGPSCSPDSHGRGCLDGVAVAGL